MRSWTLAAAVALLALLPAVSRADVADFRRRPRPGPPVGAACNPEAQSADGSECVECLSRREDERRCPTLLSDRRFELRCVENPDAPTAIRGEVWCRAASRWAPVDADLRAALGDPSRQAAPRPEERPPAPALPPVASPIVLGKADPSQKPKAFSCATAGSGAAPIWVALGSLLLAARAIRRGRAER